MSAAREVLLGDVDPDLAVVLAALYGPSWRDVVREHLAEQLAEQLGEQTPAPGAPPVAANRGEDEPAPGDAGGPGRAP